LYTQNLVRTTFIPEEIFHIIIFIQTTGFLDQLNEVNTYYNFYQNFGSHSTTETSVFLFVVLELVWRVINTFRVDTSLNNDIYCTKVMVKQSCYMPGVAQRVPGS
jgi:hypothetical protein